MPRIPYNPHVRLAVLIPVHDAAPDLRRTLASLAPDPFPFDVVETPVYGGRKIDGWFGFVGVKVRPIAGRPAGRDAPALCSTEVA